MSSHRATLQQKYPDLEFSVLGDESTYGLWMARVETKDPVAKWEQLRADHEVTGLWPLILSAEEPSLRNLAEQLKGFGEGRSTPEELAAKSLDYTTVEQIQADLMADLEPEDQHLPEASMPEPPRSSSVTAEYSLVRMGSTVANKAGLFSRLKGRAHQHLFGFVPAKQPWEIFCYLNYGSWNDCPAPPLHAALHRIWADLYGAEPVTLAFDTVECRVNRLPGEPKEALDLALLQYRYCLDIVDQGVESVTALAELLMSSKSWYFWWD